MPTVIGALRRMLLAPPLAEVSLDRRGFLPAEPAVTTRLERIPRTVIVGFEAGMEARDVREIGWRLELVEEELCGFAYEGATMALTIRDQLLPGRRGLSRELLLGPAHRHAFLTYIGIGFAMARLPRPRWRKVLPDLTGSPYYPQLSWLAVDGYGFDLAFFHPGRWVTQQRRPRPYPWLDAPDYFGRAVDQGIGRALWFLYGANVDEVAAAVGRFAGERRPDLWSGVGLAAGVAGGAGAAELPRLREAALGYRAELAQGAAFAAKARSFAGLVPEHTEAAVRALTGLSATDAAAVVDEAVASAGEAGPVDRDPRYEHWRAGVRERLAAHTGGT